jgi:hypothetical protein
MSEITSRSGLTYRLRPEAWAEICQRMNWATQKDASAATGITAATISRVLGGSLRPGLGFMATLMTTLAADCERHWYHEDVFEIVSEDSPPPAECLALRRRRSPAAAGRRARRAA